MNHYFTNNDNLEDNKREIDVQLLSTSFRFYTNSGVFSKNAIDFGSKVLIESISLDENDHKILDMGCGYGPIGISIAKVYKRNVLMADINEKAVLLAKDNILLNKVDNISVVVSNLFENIKDKFDVVITNPPIRTGKQNIFSLYEQAYHHLNENGRLFVVIQKKQGALSTYKFLENLYRFVEVVVKEKGYWVIKAKK